MNNKYLLITFTCLLGMGFIQQKNGSNLIFSQKKMEDTTAARLKNTLPQSGKFVNGKPVGKHWINLLALPDSWNADTRFWKFDKETLHGEYDGGKTHNYAWTKTHYKDYELNVMIRMLGREANSGVCIRINPTDADKVPGYQVDMGPGYWGCLWEEGRAGMVQAFPKNLADKLVKTDDWNHYYIIAKGHHIQAWLNGVKTIDITHDAGFDNGAIGFQLCHGDKRTVLDVKQLYLRESK